MKNRIITVFMLALVLFGCGSPVMPNNDSPSNDASNDETSVNTVALLDELELAIQGTWIMDTETLHPNEIDFFLNDSRRLVLRYTWGGMGGQYVHPEYVFSGLVYDGEDITFLTQGSNPREVTVTGTVSEGKLTISGFTIFQHSSAQILPGVYVSPLNARPWNGTYVKKEPPGE